MRVTLVTPVYNQAEFLGATIESVLAQDYSELEYLVIDDGSSDDSLLVAQRYEAANPGRLTVLTQLNAGQAATLNRGWQLGQGELLGYLSSDDCLLPGAISSAVSALAAAPDAAVAYCDFELIDVAGRSIRAVRTEDFDAKRLQVDLVCQPGPGAFFRRHVFDQTGGWRADLRQVPDFEFWLRASRLGPFFRVPAILAQYRVHEGSASFRVMPEARAEEILGVVRAYYGPVSSQQSSVALSMAHCLVAKNHAQSVRLFAALSHWWKALRLAPLAALRPAALRPLFSGALRRLRYLKRA
ncbi:MAG: glycosyltransferase [Burkholderiales bacterium]